MDGATLIRIIAGVLAVVVLAVIVWRRRRASSAE
jgi:MYXO-CTERM domain-containing protein